MKKILYLLLPSFLIIIIFSGCIVEPKLSEIPKITFKSIERKMVDSDYKLFVTIDFEDGDGDLGLNANKEDKGLDSIYGKNFHNFFMKLYVKNEIGGFIESDFTKGTGILNGCFGRIPTPGNNKSLVGTLTFNLDNPLRLYVNDTIKFDIFIKDRALNSSNIVESNELLIVE